jgi:hypothetical protein
MSVKAFFIAAPLSLGLLWAPAAYDIYKAISALTAPAVHFEAITYSGDLYILGVGDTCNDAWLNHGPVPADWRELRCVPAS